MRTVELAISGQRYKIRSDEQEEYLKNLASYVDERLTEIRRKTKTAGTQGMAVLAALNIADELFKSRQRESRIRQQMKEKIQRILKLVQAEH